MKLNRKGFTLVEIMIVVAIIALLAAIAIPSFLKSRTEARISSCINNLRLIDHAKEQYATKNNLNAGATVVNADIDSYMKKAPTCPASGTYTYGVIGTNPTCSVAQHVLP